MTHPNDDTQGAARPDTDDAASAGASVSPPASPTLSYADPVTVDRVKMALRKVKDPELNLNVVDLGLIYDIAVEGANVKVDMSLTSPGCPSGPQIMGDVERMVKTVDGVEEVAVNLVWSPMWTPERIEPRVRAYMGM
jgi:metal-sulfur cluster biosynthetic enzyme